MKTEKIILSFIAALIGLGVAGGAFYFYEASRAITKPQTKTVYITSITPTPKQSIFLNVDLPKDEDVVSNKVITVSGKTVPDAIISIISDNYQDVITPSQNGGFSTTININDGQNLIEITATLPNGESTKVKRVITFSTEEF